MSLIVVADRAAETLGNMPSTFIASFSPLKIRNFRIYLGGQAISLIGTWMQSTAQAWVVWELTKSDAALGIVGALNTVPLLVLGLFAGVWIDRLDRRRLLIVIQTSGMILAFIFALLEQTHLIQLWHIYVLSLLLGIVNAFDMPSQQTFLGDLSGISEVRKAVTLNAMIIQVSRMIGPSLAGLVIARLGAATAFWLNGASFLVVIGSLLMVRTVRQVRASSGGSVVEGYKSALSFLRTQPRLQDLMVFTALVTFFGISVLYVVPSVAPEVLKGNEELYGILLGASGAGALFSAVFVAPVAQSLKRTGLAMAGAVMWMGVWLIMFSLTTSVPAALATIFVWSISAPLVIATTLGLMQIYAPTAMRARMVSFGLQPLASLFIGTSGELLGVATAIRLNGVLMVAGSAVLLLARSKLRRWDAKAAAPDAARLEVQPAGH